jgi:WD40 repeat protein
VHLLEITVQRAIERTWPVVAFHEDGRGLRVRVQGVLELDPGTLPTVYTSIRAYGTVLGRALFHDALGQALDRARQEAEDGVRVLLQVEADDLRDLRWERLCAPVDGRWDHLLLDQATPFTLFLPTGNDRRFPPIGRDELRALLVTASPTALDTYDLAPFDGAAMTDRARASLGDIPCDVLAPVKYAAGLPTLDALCAQITASPYSLLHVICHGRYLRSVAGGSETVLYLQKEDGGVDPVTATRLIERLARLRGPRGLPRLTFLASCETAAGDVGAAHGGLAQRLVRELGMPAVIAMTSRVSVETASTLSAAFYRQVRQHGEIDRALAEATAGLAERPDVTVSALFSRLRGHPLFTEALDQALLTEDVEHGLTRAAVLLSERAPVLEERFENAAKVVAASARIGAVGGVAPSREDQEQAVADLETLCEEAFELSFHALALGHEPPPYDSRCPFRGLYPFRPEDNEFFFGREALVSRLLARLSQERFLAVLGASGSGKSSLVFAGLVAALLADDPRFSWVSIAPGVEPSRSLEHALAATDPALLIIDQFEEAFTLCTDSTKQRAFIHSVCQLAKDKMVVVTMRADFWGEVAPHRSLRELMVKHQELIAPMDGAELRQAVERQAERVRLRFEADLVNTLLDDLEGEPGGMPLLQHALAELWSRRHGQWLRTEEYRALGGVREAIARTADDVYERLSPDDQDRMRDIFIRLTRLDEDALPGEPRRDTRRRVEFDELVPAGTDPVDTRALVARLANARLVVTSPDPTSVTDDVEVAHEALIRYWPRLRAWLDEDHVRIRLRESIRRAAREWEESRGRETLLTFRGERLEEALTLASHPNALNERERRFIDACAALRARELAEDEAQQRLISNQKVAERLGDQAHRIEREVQSRPLDALAFAVATVGANLRELPDHMLVPVASSLHLAIELARERAMTHGHGAAVTSVAFAPDGQSIVTASDDAIVRVWDLTGGPVGDPLRGHEGRVLAVSYAPDGRTIISAGADKTVRLWDITRERVGSIIGRHDDEVTSVAFVLDASTVVSESDDGTVRVWDEDGGQRRIFTAGGALPVSMAVSANGHMVAVGTDRGTILLIDLNAGDSAPGGPFAGHEGLVTALAFAPGADAIASGGEDGTVRVWTSDGRAIGEPFTGHEGVVMAVAFSPDGAVIASGGADGMVRLSDRRGRPVGDPLRGHGDYVLSVAFDPSGTLIASGSADRTLRVWDRFGLELRSPFEGHTSHVNTVAVAPDGKVIVSGSADRCLRFWRPDGTEARQPLEAHDGFVYSVDISPDGRTLASASADHTAKLWNAGGELIAPPLPHPDMVSRVAFSPDGAAVITACGDGSIRRWNLEGALLASARGLHERAALVCAYSPDGAIVLSGGLDGTLRLWDLVRDEVRALNERGAGVSCLAFDRATGRFVSGSLDGMLQRWDSSGTASGPPLKAHEGELRCVAVCDDTIVTGGADGVLRLWGLDGTPVGRPLRGHLGTVWSVAVEPEASFLVSGGADATVRLWRGPTWRSWLQVACERLAGHRRVVPHDADPWREAFDVCSQTW